MEIRRLDRANLTPAYGIEGERLRPWDVLNAPFEGAWCVVRAGGESTPHSHHEYEIFIAMSGNAALVVDGVEHEFVAGDIVHLPPGCTHKVVNPSSEDFEYYGIWWDTDMSEVFLTRHQKETPV
ncbi:cupin domain-containing protein [Streptomyces ipomoeae]|uniref:cupin domain-containing protein n=1 Tax=Streptomyces ipomoeae TaxID=103232 RepID=UPI00114644C4|nr:cupin domain-containing protein [Streptomyces ipomoeae]MDX2934604.1 cupin domain-containing protein [Streptomyces ipomoeae]TQE19003.1 cupin domain-containing protein [Streptomyces ipomoeae]TQE25554.1 cupin domain-containing protein [Streptomyces ipomoeae]